MTRKQSWFPIAYMFLVTAFFSSIVIGLTRVTGERVQANQKLAFERAVLSVLPGVNVQTKTRPQIHETFGEMMSEPNELSNGAYTARREGRIVAYVVPIAGQGFWAPIKGVIGLKTDKKTVTGIAFYQQNETPGLGAEITKPAFKNQFQGKVLASSGQPLKIRRPGAVLGNNEVHAITGATQTSDRLQIIIDEALRKWQGRGEKEGEGRES
ncbi:MAG: FMN-binding protein [Sedimentisphaerales bacterium]|jgi:Na+-transporting NADH:ubiquinone oxidoreductase subunit C